MRRLALLYYVVPALGVAGELVKCKNEYMELMFDNNIKPRVGSYINEVENTHVIYDNTTINYLLNSPKELDVRDSPHSIIPQAISLMLNGVIEEQWANEKANLSVMDYVSRLSFNESVITID